MQREAERTEITLKVERAKLRGEMQVRIQMGAGQALIFSKY